MFDSFKNVSSYPFSQQDLNLQMVEQAAVYPYEELAEYKSKRRHEGASQIYSFEEETKENSNA